MGVVTKDACRRQIFLEEPDPPYRICDSQLTDAQAIE